MPRGIFWLRTAQRTQAAAPAADAPRPDAPPSPFDEPMMRRALALARQAERLGEVPVGAVVYRTATGEVLAEAHNRRETDADPSSHAEFIAILKAARALGDWRLNDSSLAVTLEPCPMCAGLIVNARLGRVVYGAPDPKAGAVRSLMQIADDPRLNHRAAIIPGILAEPCAAVLTGFFRALRQRPKGPQIERPHPP